MSPKPIDRVFNPQDKQHMIPVRCPNGHVHHYDRRTICTETGGVVRGAEAVPRSNLDEVWLTCLEAGCCVEFVVQMDCAGYRAPR